MSIENNIARIADALEHLAAVADHMIAMNQNALTKSLQNDTTVEAVAPVAEKKSRSKKTAPPATEPAEAVVTGEVLSAEPPQPEPAHGAPAMTLDECNAVLREVVMAKNNGSAIMDLLGAYAPATRALRDIDPVHYPEIAQRAREL